MQRKDTKQEYTGPRKKKNPIARLSFSKVLELTIKLKALNKPSDNYNVSLIWAWAECRVREKKLADFLKKSQIDAGFFGRSPDERQLEIATLVTEQEKYLADHLHVMDEVKYRKPR